MTARARLLTSVFLSLFPGLTACSSTDASSTHDQGSDASVVDDADAGAVGSDSAIEAVSHGDVADPDGGGDLGTPLDAADGALVDGGEAGLPTGALSKDDFAAKLAQVACADATSCCTKPVADCVSVETTKIRGALDVAGANYDSAAAGRCIDAFRASKTCDARATSERFVASCAGVVDGTAKVGEACTGPETCQRASLGFDTKSGFVGCASVGSDPTRRCFEFVPVGAPGDACSTSFIAGKYTIDLCAPPNECGSDGKCFLPPSAGAACTGTCTAGTRCVTGVCKALPKAGEACPDGACGFGATCTSATCVSDPPIPPYACIGFACPLDGLCTL
jgi:hypothetical protein